MEVADFDADHFLLWLSFGIVCDSDSGVGRQVGRWSGCSTMRRNFDIVISHDRCGCFIPLPPAPSFFFSCAARRGGLGFTRALHTHQNEGSTLSPLQHPCCFPTLLTYTREPVSILQFHAFLPPVFHSRVRAIL